MVLREARQAEHDVRRRSCSEVDQLKRRTRLYLRVAGSDISLEKLEVPVLSVLPLMAKVLVRSKRWFKTGAIPSPYVEGRLLCPSPMTFSGWVVQQQDGKVYMLGKRLCQVRKAREPESSWELKATLKSRASGCIPRPHQKGS